MEMDEELLLSAEENPDNAAFHLLLYPTNKYPPSGLWTISPCVGFKLSDNLPLLVSMPYFNLADDDVKDAIIIEDPFYSDMVPYFNVDPVRLLPSSNTSSLISSTILKNQIAF